MIIDKPMTEHRFENILDRRLGIYWEGNEYYPAPILPEDQIVTVKDIYCQRYCFEESDTVDKEHDAVNSCLTVLRKFIFTDYFDNRYQIYIEPSAEIPSRIRSYKGILSKNNNQDDFIEIELPFENKTVIGGIINLSDENYYKNIEKIWSRNTSFILCSKLNYFSKEFITDLIEHYREKKRNTSINYFKLIVDFCKRGDIVYKIGGYVSETSITLDVFQSK